MLVKSRPFEPGDDEQETWIEDGHGRRLTGAALEKFFADSLLQSEEFQSWVPETDGIPKAYSPQDVAKAWDVSPEFVRLLFANEPGVLRFSKTGKSSKRARSYTTIRIPKPVLLRVFKKWQRVTRTRR